VDGRRLSDWLEPLVEELAREFDAVEMRLFGSVARGDDDGDSDLDVLVVLDAYEPNEAVALKQRAILAVSSPVPFDVAFTDPERLASRSRIAGTLERAATREGRVVYRRDD
jgi:predicted nucleotidyltransferase